MLDNPIEMLDTKVPNKLGWQILPIKSKRALPRMMMPSAVQVGGDQILIFGGGIKEIYVFNVSSGRIRKTRTKASCKLWTDGMATVCMAQTNPR
mmetsp:Transcript_5189/g.6366  ORF Transcript_5189/g.6366 Transcript_5189/m.6366 type:complete len:94 (+) Transcript_5189:669-950(+)